jgi:CheY-like chemotaxis protein
MTDWKSRPTKEAMHQGPLVLIIDNDPEMRELLETLFELIGFATFQAGNNTEALAQALTHHPDLITTDMFRPGGSGHEFIQQIRAITALQDTPIVMISGGATPKERQQVSRFGLTLTMPKPFEPSEFYATIEQFIPKERWQIYEPPTWRHLVSDHNLDD